MLKRLNLILTADDADILRHISTKKHLSDYIRQLIRNDMKAADTSSNPIHTLSSQISKIEDLIKKLPDRLRNGY